MPLLKENSEKKNKNTRIHHKYPVDIISAGYYIIK